MKTRTPFVGLRRIFGYCGIILMAACDKSTAPAPQLTLSNSNVALASCKSHRLAAFAPDGTTPSGIEWTSSSSTVAGVDENGIVTGYQSGTATVTAKAPSSGFASTSATINVTAPAAWMELAGAVDARTQARLVSNSTTIAVGDSADILARYEPGGCRSGDWAISDISLVLGTTSAEDLTSRGWQRVVPNANNWYRTLSPDRVISHAPRTVAFRLRTTDQTDSRDFVYPGGGYTATLRLRMGGQTMIGVNGYSLFVQAR